MKTSEILEKLTAYTDIAQQVTGLFGIVIPGVNIALKAINGLIGMFNKESLDKDWTQEEIDAVASEYERKQDELMKRFEDDTNPGGLDLEDE